MSVVEKIVVVTPLYAIGLSKSIALPLLFDEVASAFLHAMEMEIIYAQIILKLNQLNEYSRNE